MKNAMIKRQTVTGDELARASERYMIRRRAEKELERINGMYYIYELNGVRREIF